MPRVPSYDNLQTSISNQPQVQVAAPTVKDVANEQGQQLGRAMQSAGSDAGRIALDMQQDANKVRVNDAMNRAVSARLGLQVDALQQKGRNALERESGKDLASEYDERLGAELDALTNSLGNDAQKAEFKAQSDQLRQQFRGTVTGHMVREQETFADETDDATIKTAIEQGVLLYGDTAMRQQSVDAISATIDRLAMRKGWSPEIRATKLAEAVSPMHAGIIKSMIQSGNAEAAQSYYDENSASMSLQSRASVQEPLQRAVFAQKADNEAVGIWAEVGPRSKDDAVRLFDMDKLVDERITDVALRKEVKTALRTKAQAWNEQQTELKAQHEAGLWKLADDGATLSQIRRSDAYLGLGEADQHRFEVAWQAERAQEAGRALTADQRELTRLQIQEKRREIEGVDTYLSLSDPAELSKIKSRTQIEALRTVIGKEKTESLLSKWDDLQKPGRLPLAKMDDNDFKATAAQMGLDVFESKADPEDKAIVARVRMDVEQIITERERSAGKPLTREERVGVMRKALAAEVTLKRKWRDDVPVRAALVADDALGEVVIPDSERPLLAEALAAGYRRDPGNPMYAPTQENMARLYLQGRMRQGNQ